MVGSVFSQFKNMMAVTIFIRDWMQAILTDSFVALVDVLFELNPVVGLRAPIPGKTYIRDFVYCKSSHAVPYHASSGRTAPCKT